MTPSRFFQTQESHSVDTLRQDSSSLEFPDHSCTCTLRNPRQAYLKTGMQLEMGQNNLGRTKAKRKLLKPVVRRPVNNPSS